MTIRRREKILQYHLDYEFDWTKDRKESKGCIDMYK